MTLDHVIAERTLLLDGEPKVTVRIARPEPADEGEYVCRYEIAGLAHVGPGRIYGADGVQALVLALHLIAVKLEGSVEAKAGRLGPLDHTGSFGLRYPDDAAALHYHAERGWLREIERQSLEDWIEAEVAPLARPGLIDGAITHLRARLDKEERHEARLLLLCELARLLQASGREGEACAVLEEQRAVAPDDPRPAYRLAASLFHAGGGYGAAAGTLQAALAAIDAALERSRRAGYLLRHCLNMRARIVVALKRFDLLALTLRELLAPPAPLPVRDVRMADDFLEQVPHGAVDAALLQRYRERLESERRMAAEATAPGGGLRAWAPPETHVFDALRAWGALSDEELRERFSPAAVETLRRIGAELLDGDPFAPADRDRFPQLVRIFNAVLDAGSHALGQALIEAGEHKKRGQAEAFGVVMRRFVERCPSRFHRQIAEHYLAGTRREGA